MSEERNLMMANDMAMAYPQLYAVTWFVTGFMACVLGVIVLSWALHATNHPSSHRPETK
jgi:branched-subunit amino acid ABC-type transport system permease component